MIRKIIAACMIIFFTAAIPATVFAASEPKSDRVFQATGGGQAPLNWDQRDSFAKTFARQVARMDALRNLAEKISGVFVETKEITAPDGTEHEIIKTRLPHDSKVFKLLKKNARQVGDAKFYFDNDGVLFCEVTMEVVVPADWKN